MKLILVSQNKEVQHEYDGLILSSVSYKNTFLIKNRDKDIVYGRYNSKERAKEVMDEVLDILKKDKLIINNMANFIDTENKQEFDDWLKENTPFNNGLIISHEQRNIVKQDYVVYEFPKE